MAGGRSARGSRRHAAAASVVVPFPRDAAGARLDLARFVPSGRSLLATIGVLAAAGVAYCRRGRRRRSSRSSESTSAAHRLRSHARSPCATRDLVGQSLVTIDAEDVEGTLRALPAVAGVSVDRAFPHTLVVKVAPERPVAVVRRGDSSWLVTGAGKVDPPRSRPAPSARFPRLWLAKGTTIRLGGSVPAGWLPATRALAEAHSVGLALAGQGHPSRRRRADARAAAGTEIQARARRPRSGSSSPSPRRSSQLVDGRTELRRRERSAASSRRMTTFKSLLELESYDVATR